MKILMLNHEFPPMGGGAGRATFNIAKELYKMGHQVDILTSAYKNYTRDEVIDGVQIYRVQSKKKHILETDLVGILLYTIFGMNKFRKLLKQNDYDLTHSFFSIPAGIISLFGNKVYGIPYVVSLRGSDVPNYDPYKLNYIHKISKPLTKLIWKNAIKTVALSNGLKDIALKTDPTLNFAVVYNGIDTTIFKRLKRKNESENVKLICVARLLKRKGIHHLLLALSQMNLNNVELLIVGTGNFENELKGLSAKFNLNKTVSFFGYCNNYKLPELYSGADIFVLPSLTESFGIVFAEAMACGLPIIGTTAGGIPEVVRNGENGVLVPPGNVNKLKNALVKLINNNELRKKMGEKSIKIVQENFTWNKIAKDYLQIYEEVI
jgi:glycosyltransferase involved in cell wall biosynthesis